MNRILLALALACAASPALAAEGVAQLGTAGDTVVVFPVGQWILALSNAFFQIVAPILVSLIVGFIATKYPILSSFISEKVIEDQVGKFTDYALNAERGALKGAHLDVNVGQSVLATTVARAMESANVNLLARKAMAAAGGPEAIAKKAFRKLNLDDTATAENVLVPVLRKIEDGTLLPERIGSLKVVPHQPTTDVPKVEPKPAAKAAAPVKPVVRH